MKTETKLWPLQGEQGFIEKWSSDLVSAPTWPIFLLEQDIVKTNILVKFFED